MDETMTGKDRDEASGQYEDTYPEEEFLDAIQELGGGGTREIAEQVGCHRDTARRRLNSLAEKGAVSRRDVGDSALWLIADE
jgi:predicted ArsR family transcriptional regulator